MNMLTKSTAQGLSLPPEVFFEVSKAPSVKSFSLMSFMMVFSNLRHKTFQFYFL
jgi:hypothetical protein